MLTLLCLAWSAGRGCFAPDRESIEHLFGKTIYTDGTMRRLPWGSTLGKSDSLRDRAHEKMADWISAFLHDSPPKVHHMDDKIQPYLEAPTDPKLWRVDLKGECNFDSAGEKVKKDFLVVAPVGRGFNVSAMWLDHPLSSNWDFAAIYYEDIDAPCNHCTYTFGPIKGPKWHVLKAAMRMYPKEWEHMQSKYKAIMIPDDDVLMDTCTINRAFELFHAYNLLMAQPSLCAEYRSSTWYPLVYQSSPSLSVMRLVTFVEIMAPIYQMEYFSHVIAPSLYNAFSGWGLDFIHPFLLKYPETRIAVIDEVCVSHPNLAGFRRKGSMYNSTLPYSERLEEQSRELEYNYTPQECAKLGYGFRPMEVLGMVQKGPQLQILKGNTMPAAHSFSEKRIIAGDAVREETADTLSPQAQSYTYSPAAVELWAGLAFLGAALLYGCTMHVARTKGRSAHALPMPLKKV